MSRTTASRSAPHAELEELAAGGGAEGDGGQAEEDAQRHVRPGPRPRPLLEEGEGLPREGGERGEPAAHADREEGADLGRDVRAREREAEHEAGDEGPGHVDGEGADGEGGGEPLDDTGEEPATGPAEGAAEGDVPEHGPNVAG